MPVRDENGNAPSSKLADFEADVVALARATLRSNRDAVIGEMASLQGAMGAAVTVDLQEQALSIANAASTYTATLERAVWVRDRPEGLWAKFLSSLVGGSWSVGHFDPQRPERGPARDSIYNGAEAMRWSDARDCLELCTSVYSVLLVNSPALLALQLRGGEALLRSAGEGDTEAACGSMTSALNMTLIDMFEMEATLGEGSVTWRSLPIVCLRLLAGAEVPGGSGLDWSHVGSTERKAALMLQNLTGASPEPLSEGATLGIPWASVGAGQPGGDVPLVRAVVQASPPTLLPRTTWTSPILSMEDALNRWRTAEDRLRVEDTEQATATLHAIRKMLEAHPPFRTA